MTRVDSCTFYTVLYTSYVALTAPVHTPHSPIVVGTDCGPVWYRHLKPLHPRPQSNIAMRVTFATEIGDSYTVEIDPQMELENIMALLEAEVSSPKLR